MTNLVRQHLIFFGEVQHVGFRYEMATLAHQAGITGWVRNKDDGTVEAEVQGNPTAIESLLNDLAHTPPIEISHITRSNITFKKNEQSFRTIYY